MRHGSASPPPPASELIPIVSEQRRPVSRVSQRRSSLGSDALTGCELTVLKNLTMLCAGPSESLRGFCRRVSRSACRERIFSCNPLRASRALYSGRRMVGGKILGGPIPHGIGSLTSFQIL